MSPDKNAADLFLQMVNEEPEHQPSQRGGLVTARIESGNAQDGWMISTGGKSDMPLPVSEAVGELAIGMEVEVVVLRSKSGETHASQKKAAAEKVRSGLYEAKENNTPLLAKVEKLVTNKEGQNAGYEVSLSGVRAFLPMSQVRAPKEAAELVGKEFNVTVLDITGRDRVVVSERGSRERSNREHFDTFVAANNIGTHLKATVHNVEETYAILMAGEMSLFMHVTEFDWKYIKNLKDTLKPGDTLDVIIQLIDPEKRSVKVSRKAGLPNPIDTFLKSRRVGEVFNATVLRFARTVVIVESPEGAELFLPFTEISWTARVSDPKKYLNIGDIIEVAVKDIDTERSRASVSLRDRLENPWYSAGQKYAVGTMHQGLLTSITDFGIFLTFEDGIQGLIRREDVDWNDIEADLSARYKKGESVTATVLSVEPERERVRLGIKQLSKNPFQDFADKHPAGSAVTAVVTDADRDGLYVDVDGMPAFIHVSQISNEHVEDARSTHQVGESVKAAVRRINFAARRIELSIRDADRAQEKKEIEHFSQGSDSAPTTLGDIFKLSVPEEAPKARRGKKSEESSEE